MKITHRHRHISESEHQPGISVQTHDAPFLSPKNATGNTNFLLLLKIVLQRTVHQFDIVRHGFVQIDKFLHLALSQNTHLKSTKEKVPTRPQAYLIESYLRAIELIDTDDVKTDANNIRSRLNSFLKKYDTVEALLDYKAFKLSPYNIGGTKLW